jgi:hypothetical protein
MPAPAAVVFSRIATPSRVPTAVTSRNLSVLQNLFNTHHGDASDIANARFFLKENPSIGNVRSITMKVVETVL